AALGHPRHLVALPFRLEAHAEDAEPQRFRRTAHAVEVFLYFAAGLVDGFQRCAGKFELARGFQRDRGIAARQRDHVAVFLHRIPAAAGDAFQQRADAAFAFVRRRPQVVGAEHEFLVFGADLPLRSRAAAGSEIFHELRAPFDRLFGNVTGTRHARAFNGARRSRWGGVMRSASGWRRVIFEASAFDMDQSGRPRAGTSTVMPLQKSASIHVQDAPHTSRTSPSNAAAAARASSRPVPAGAENAMVCARQCCLAISASTSRWRVRAWARENLSALLSSTTHGSSISAQ